MVGEHSGECQTAIEAAPLAKVVARREQKRFA
jgi:hypothetical protein